MLCDTYIYIVIYIYVYKIHWWGEVISYWCETVWKPSAHSGSVRRILFWGLIRFDAVTLHNACYPRHLLWGPDNDNLGFKEISESDMGNEVPLDTRKEPGSPSGVETITYKAPENTQWTLEHDPYSSAQWNKGSLVWYQESKSALCVHQDWVNNSLPVSGKGTTVWFLPVSFTFQRIMCPEFSVKERSSVEWIFRGHLMKLSRHVA